MWVDSVFAIGYKKGQTQLGQKISRQLRVMGELITHAKQKIKDLVACQWWTCNWGEKRAKPSCKSIVDLQLQLKTIKGCPTNWNKTRVCPVASWWLTCNWNQQKSWTVKNINRTKNKKRKNKKKRLEASPKTSTSLVSSFTHIRSTETKTKQLRGSSYKGHTATDTLSSPLKKQFTRSPGWKPTKHKNGDPYNKQKSLQRAGGCTHFFFFFFYPQKKHKRPRSTKGHNCHVRTSDTVHGPPHLVWT